MRVGPQRSRPAYPRHFAQALHFARLPGRVVGGMSNFRNHRLGVGVGESDVQGSRAEYARRGVGLRACDPERACPGFTLFAPVFEQNGTVYLINLQGELVHSWLLPYAPGFSPSAGRCSTTGALQRKTF